MISVIIICQKIDDNLLRTIKSVSALKPQILIGLSNSNEALGVRKNRLIQIASFEWILVLDTDECASSVLLKSINNIITEKNDLVGYSIQYENYALGGRIFYGGESYAKKRLFNKKFGKINEVPIHEEIELCGNVGNIDGAIYHNSYTSIRHVLMKFTKYAWQMAGEKRKVHEGVTLKKLFMYGPHMVWARAVKDEGWRDGWRGIVIALCFGYMETLIYWFLLIKIVLHLP